MKRTRHGVSGALTVSLLFAKAATGQLPPLFQVDTIGSGVYVIWDSDALAMPVHGNTTVVVGERSVLVVDGNRTASAALATLSILRGLTDEPVTHLVNTHWHEDHVLGNAVYADTFPNVAIVAHTATDLAMRREAEEEFAPFVEGLERQLALWEARTRSGRGPDGEALSPEALVRARRQHDMYAYLVPEDRAARWTFPTVMFTDQIRLDLGDRLVELLHFGRGNTAGDVAVLIPSVRTLVAGDLLVFPVPYGSGSFPSEWVEVMRSLSRLDFDRVVPGHGPVLADREYLRSFSNLLEYVVERATAGHAAGHSAEQILADVADSDPVVGFTESVEARQALRPFFLRPVVERTLEMLSGHLAQLSSAARAPG